MVIVFHEVLPSFFKILDKPHFERVISLSQECLNTHYYSSIGPGISEREVFVWDLENISPTRYSYHSETYSPSVANANTKWITSGVRTPSNNLLAYYN